MRALIVLSLIFSASVGIVKDNCDHLRGIYVGTKLGPGRYHIQYQLDPRTGLSGLANAVLVLAKGEFKDSGRFNGPISYKRDGSTTITVNGFDRKVPVFKECSK